MGFDASDLSFWGEKLRFDASDANSSTQKMEKVGISRHFF
jgi:hypothetical protein